MRIPDSYLKIAGTITAVILLIAASGIAINFTLLRTFIAAGLLIFGVFLIINRYHHYSISALGLALIYYPALHVTLPRHFWAILDIAVAAGLWYAVQHTTDSYLKGASFEKYIAERFPASDYAIETRTHDSSRFLGRFVETDVDPDFVFRDKRTNRSFAVECKWRKGWTGDKSIGLGLTWDTWKGGRYISYGTKNKMPVFVALGIGGTPAKPAETYFLKADQLQYRFLKQEFVKSGKTIYQLGELLS